LKVWLIELAAPCLVLRLPWLKWLIDIRGMVAEWMQQLLIYQDRDMRREDIERKLEAMPGEIERERVQIRELHSSVEAALAELRELDVQRLRHEGAIADAEEAVRKYRNQQLQVKKNEEYAALEHEIAAMQEKISCIEDEALQLLETIERKTATTAELQARVDDEVGMLERQIERLEQATAGNRSQHAKAQEAVSDCAAKLDAAVLAQYQYVRSQVKRPPVVVAIEEGRCQGCRLKVSSQTDSAARKGHELTRCENCGRIVYFGS
jgi:predicted  nucleic acid-binding Zn-ribbon protein